MKNLIKAWVRREVEQDSKKVSAGIICGNCAHYVPQDAERGKCKRYPNMLDGRGTFAEFVGCEGGFCKI